MARAKRDNATKVTISIDIDVLFSAKHKALDERLTLSDYIQDLVMKDIGKKPVSEEEKPEIKEVKAKTKPRIKKNVSNQELPPATEPVQALGTDIFEGVEEVLEDNQASDKEILQLIVDGHSYQESANLLNEKGKVTKTGKPFNFENFKSRLKSIRKNNGGSK